MAINPPNYTQIPNDIFDLLKLKGTEHITESELKVVLVICRKTFGWHKVRDRISLSQLESLTGMSRQGVLNGVNAAKKRGIILAHEVTNGIEYEVNVVNEVDQPTQTARQRSRPRLGNEVDPQKKQLNKEDFSAGAQIPKCRQRDLFFDKLTEITGSDPILNGSLLGKTKSQLIKANATLEQLDQFCSYWYAADWRGQKGQLPTLTQITSEWGKAKTWEGNSQSAGASTNNGEWEWATIPTGIVLRHKGGTFPSLRGEEAKQKAREVGLEVIF